MQYDMSQAELIEAVQFYLNERILKRPVTIKRVEPRDAKKLGIGYVLHVTVTDDQQHMDPELVDAVRESAA